MAIERLNKDISIEKEQELIKKLYDYICFDLSSVENDISNGYLTCNLGNNDKVYFWYFDEAKSVAIDMDGNIIDETPNSFTNETLKGILYD